MIAVLLYGCTMKRNTPESKVTENDTPRVSFQCNHKIVRTSDMVNQPAASGHRSVQTGLRCVLLVSISVLHPIRELNIHANFSYIVSGLFVFTFYLFRIRGAANIFQNYNVRQANGILG
eukprot:6199509-Pleurochrysis_carterae.AAC.5